MCTSVRALYQAPVIWKSSREGGPPPTQGYILLHPGRVQKSLLPNGSTANLMQAEETFQEFFGREPCLCPTYTVSSLTRIILKTNLFYAIRYRLWNSTPGTWRRLQRWSRTYISKRRRKLYTRIYVDAGRGQTPSGKDPANFAGRVALRRVAPGRPAVLRSTKMFLRGMQPGIRTWKSLTIASTSFDKRSSHIPAVLHFPAVVIDLLWPAATVVWRKSGCIYWMRGTFSWSRYILYYNKKILWSISFEKCITFVLNLYSLYK